MHIVDLEHYNYDLPKPLPTVLAIGWLERGKEYVHGKCPADFVEKLQRIVLQMPVNQMRGTHRCDFCKKDDILLTVETKSRLLGSAEIWIPRTDGQIIFAAPNLIFHYIAEHGYLPPSCFIESVNEFRENSTWDGQIICERLIRSAYQ